MSTWLDGGRHCERLKKCSDCTTKFTSVNAPLSRSVHLSRDTVSRTLTRFGEVGLSWPLTPDIDDTKLETVLFPNPQGRPKNCEEPNWSYIHLEYKKKGVTLQLLWEEYKAEHRDAYQYSQFCERYRQWKKTLQISMILDQVFPEFKGVFGDLYSKVSLHVLLEFPTGEALLAVEQSELAHRIEILCPSRTIAYAGVDPSVFSSGKFTATINRITKRGSNTLRHSLFVAVLCSLRKSGSQRLKAFYARKREERKPHMVAVIACTNKLLHWIYALLKRKELFLDLV